MSRLKLQTL
jgi:hypothetical protein